MRILVSGGAGFIGSHIVDALVEEHEVFILDNFSTGKLENLNPKAHLIEGDIRDFNFDTLGEVNVIFHTAALARIQPSIKNPSESNMTNVYGSLRVFNYARRCGAKVVFCGSSSVYGLEESFIKPIKETDPTTPKSPYALDKLVCEKYLELFAQLYGLKYTILRYFNVYGERQLVDGAYATVIGIFLKQLKDGQPFTIVGDGNQRRDFTYVKDVVKANLLVGFSDVTGTFNIGTGTNLSVNELADLIDKKHPRVHLPERQGEAREVLADITKALALGWKPTINIQEWITNSQF